MKSKIFHRFIAASAIAKILSAQLVVTERDDREKNIQLAAGTILSKAAFSPSPTHRNSILLHIKLCDFFPGTEICMRQREEDEEEKCFFPPRCLFCSHLRTSSAEQEEKRKSKRGSGVVERSYGEISLNAPPKRKNLLKALSSSAPPANPLNIIFNLIFPAHILQLKRSKRQFK